jgi:hypothetical protein
MNLVLGVKSLALSYRNPIRNWKKCGKETSMNRRTTTKTREQVPPLRGTKQSGRMKQEGTYNNKRGWSLPLDSPDCFSRSSFAKALGGNVPSLRGTKQSRRMKHEETYNNDGCWSLCAGILDCFGRASLAMTTGGGQQSCSSYNYLRYFPLRFRSVNPDSDKKKRNKKKIK